MKQSETFIERCLAGDRLAGEIDDHIDAWHASDSDKSLGQYLGFTDEEYAQWVAKPAMLEVILRARHLQQPLADALRFIQSDLRVAARVSSEAEADDLERWLLKTGRIGQ